MLKFLWKANILLFLLLLKRCCAQEKVSKKIEYRLAKSSSIVSLNDLIDTLKNEVKNYRMSDILDIYMISEYKYLIDVEKITKAIENRLNIFDAWGEHTIQDQFDNIEFVYEKASEMNRFHHKNLVLPDERYLNFMEDYEVELNENIERIYQIAMDNVTLSFFKDDFSNEFQRFKNFCELGVSQLQLLDSMLRNVKVATAQYKISIDIIHYLLEYIGGSYKVTAEEVDRQVAKYKVFRNTYKSIMVNAFPEIWTCDPPNGYTTITSSYYNKFDYEYHISLALSLVDYRENEVVVGVRFTLVDNVYYIQMRAGKLLANGVIDENSVRWVPCVKDPSNLLSVADEFDGIDLSDIKITNDRVLVGLQLYVNSRNRIALRAASWLFDFESGQVSPDNELKIHEPETVTRTLYNMENVQHPLKAKTAGMPVLLQKKFIKLNDMARGDGYSDVVPFLDFQEVKTRPRSIVSGAGLYLRSVEGYAGFLALKLYAFNLASFIKDDTEDEG